MVCLGLLMLSTYRYPPSAGVMSKCSSHYQCTIFFPLRNDSSSQNSFTILGIPIVIVEYLAPTWSWNSRLMVQVLGGLGSSIFLSFAPFPLGSKARHSFQFRKVPVVVSFSP